MSKKIRLFKFKALKLNKNKNVLVSQFKQINWPSLS